MPFHADLHVHSKYSRATSRDLDLEHLAWWAARKGLGVVATGDCVHPAWLAEIKDKLVPTGDGLFRLKPAIETEVARTLPPACRSPVRFILSTEISTIYKKDERTRKVHHLIYAPDLAAADRLAASLARIGNIASDGRPILGLDSRDLLEVALASGPGCYLVPAHIWTPWFSALGAQSGFDSIEACYGDLAPYIFAVETGLSSDPAMNWRVSSLDRFRLTSSSDAHSPGKLGREATRFSCAPSYDAIRHALVTGEGYAGTVEFFPEEGKYHMDGHRACGVRLSPAETVKLDGRCPACGGRVTMGVAHRVDMLADRAAAVPPATAGTVTSLVPLPEILAEIVGGGAASKGVAQAYDRATALFGAELALLEDVPVEEIGRANSLLGEALARLRAGMVIREPGYDGEYGVIRLFADGELDRLTRGALLFEAPLRRRPRPERQPPAEPAAAFAEEAPALPYAASGRTGVLAGLDPDQALAAGMTEGPLVVIAGPGSGKTRMLTYRLAHLVVEHGVPAESCLALTFTRRATEELRARLRALMPAGDCAVESFHSLGLAILRAHATAAGLRPGFRIADEAERRAALAAGLGVTATAAARLLKLVSLAKRTSAPVEGDAQEALAACRRLGQAHNWVDFDDLVALAVEVLATDADIAARWRARFHHICADEFQDVDEQQYRLLLLLAGRDGNLCVIGDPDQAIYGFRGADAACFARFAQDFPTGRTVRLTRNYRSAGPIVAASARMIGTARSAGVPPRSGMGDNERARPAPLGRREPATVALHVAADERAEAAFVAGTIESLLGGHDMLTANAGTPGDDRAGTPLGFADFAVLYRTDAQSQVLRDAFDHAGIPFKKSSPAPIGAHAAVAAVLDALDGLAAGPAGRDLAARLAAAAEEVRRSENPPAAAALAEARHWLAALATSADGDATALRERVALSTEADFWDARAERVSLLTMHAAKGLEFSVVFCVGMEDGLVPFDWEALRDTPHDPADATLAEERRLFYVAMTRAKDRLFLCRAARRSWRGRLVALPPSRFLVAIPDNLVSVGVPPPAKRRANARQYSLF